MEARVEASAQKLKGRGVNDYSLSVDFRGAVRRRGNNDLKNALLLGLMRGWRFSHGLFTQFSGAGSK